MACKCVSVHVVKWRTVLRPHGSAMLENTRDAGKPGSMGRMQIAKIKQVLKPDSCKAKGRKSNPSILGSVEELLMKVAFARYNRGTCGKSAAQWCSIL